MNNRPAINPVALPAASGTGDPSAFSVVEFRRHPPRLLNLRELCLLLDISERHARDLIVERKLPAIRLGRRLLFDTAKIFAALDTLGDRPGISAASHTPS